MAKKKRKRLPSNQKILNDRPRKVFRDYIGPYEVMFSVFFILFTMAMGVWFFAQEDNYDPSDRDIAIETLIAQQVEDNLWEPPLERWVEPGSRPTGGPGAPAIDLGVFPASTLSNGWLDAYRLEVFDNDTLYEKIDGQETQYKAYGFEYLYFLSIARPQDELEVNIELYDMGEFKNALGVFAAQRSADSKVESLGDAFLYYTSVGALGIVDKYYFKFTGNAESPLIHDHVDRIVNDFAASIESGSGTPRGFAILAGDLGLDFGSIQYEPEDVFQYDFARDFWFGKPAADSEMKMFVHEAASEEDAATLIDRILEEHQWDYSVVEQDNTRTVLKHDFLETFFVIDRRGTLVYGVDHAPDHERAIGSLDEFAAEVFDSIA